MKITYKDVKEISLATKYVFMVYDENAYTDLLRVSNGWVSYKRTNFHTKKEMCSWSYQSTSNALKGKFEDLTDAFYHEYHCPHEEICATDHGSFNVRVTFKDDTYVDFHRMGDFHMVGLDNQAKAFLALIPNGEPYPDLLDMNEYEENDNDIRSNNGLDTKIEIVLGDITDEKCDAIVNAANKYLQAGGGVCGAIFNKAGYRKLQAECDKLSPIKTGEAVCTSGYNLPAKYIIHAVGPEYRGTSSAPYLKNAYINSLKVAEEKNITSIAFPSISTGIFGYPIKEAVKIALDAIMNYDYQCIKLVRIVCFDQNTYQTYLKEYENILKD